jgi:hypothetical protein
MPSVLFLEFRELMQQLLAAREAAGGELPQEQESVFVGKLDDIWWKLSEDERVLIEREQEKPS